MTQCITLFRAESLAPQVHYEEILSGMRKWFVLFGAGMLLGGLVAGYALYHLKYPG